MSDHRAWAEKRYAQGKLSAKDICTSAYSLGHLAREAGVGDLAKPPTLSGGHFEEHVSQVLNEWVYMLKG